MSCHGAEFRLHSGPVCTRKLRRLLGDGNVLRQRQAGTVDHNRLVSHIQRPFQKRKKIDSFLILVDGRDMIQVEQRITLFAEFEVLLRHSLRTLRFKLFPLQSGNLHHGDRVFIHDGLHHRFHHGQIRDIERRNDRLVLQCRSNRMFCKHMQVPPYVQKGPAGCKPLLVAQYYVSSFFASCLSISQNSMQIILKMLITIGTAKRSTISAVIAVSG